MKKRLFKTILAALLAMLLMIPYIPTSLAGTDPITMSGNLNLYNALHTAYGLDSDNGGSITTAELAGLTGELDLGSNNGITDITDIEGLEYCTGITKLTLSGNSGLTSIEPLDSVEGMALQELNMDGTGVSSLPADLQIPTLRSLNLDNTPITDTGLAGIDSSNLPNLTQLILKNCSSLHTFESIKNVNTINELFFDGSALTDLPSDMSGMTNLKYLSLGDIHDLHTMTHLYQILNLPKFHTYDSSNPATLIISNTDITNVSWLNHSAAPGMKALMWQSIPGLTLTDIGTMAYLSQVTDLELSNDTGITDAALAEIKTDMPNLTALGIPSCGITDISGLSGMDLNSLNLGSNQVTSIDTLSGMTHLSNLIMNNNYVSDISPLSGKTYLTYIDASQNYLDPTAGSADRTVLDEIAARPSSNVHYANQYKTTINYYNSYGISTKDKDTNIYYGQSITLPTVSDLPAGVGLLGWDTHGNGIWDHAAGASVNFSWPTLPIPGNTVIFNACFTGMDVISSTTNAPLYGALHTTYNLDPSNSGSIKDTELEALTDVLNLSNVTSLTNIDGLQYCKNVSKIDLSNNSSLTDLSPFNYHEMTNIETLDISGCSSLTLPQHWVMPNLTWLNISGDNKITDGGGLKPVTALPKLVTLAAEHCTGLNNFTDIKNMTCLTSLDLTGASLTDIPAYLSGMTKVDTISLENVSGLSGFSHLNSITTLPNLKSVDISGTDITDVGFLSSAPKLDTLRWKNNTGLTSTNIATMSGLASKLKSLDLSGDTSIGNNALITIRGLTNLTQLFLENCGISDFTKLTETNTMTGLIVLNLNHNSITNLSPISGLTNLTQLYISNNPVSNISYLSGMTHLNTFYATYTGVNDISVLSGKPLSDLNLACDYLDPTPGSDDMKIIDNLKAAGCNVTYNDQNQITVNYFCDGAIFVSPTPSAIVVYYGQNITLPAVCAKEGYAMTGWSTDGDYSPDHLGGEVIPFKWATMPVPGNAVTYYAINTSFDASHELSGLAASAALSPAFDPQQSCYNISIPSTVSSVTLTPQVSSPGTTFTINGESVDSKNIPVGFGSRVTVTINVINGSGMQYFVFITRDPADATCQLSGISVDPMSALTPAFSPSVSTYSITTPAAVGSVTLTPTTDASLGTTFTIDGAAVSSKTYSTYYGETSTANILVTSQDGLNTNLYQVMITRGLPDTQYLVYLGNNAGALNNNFDPYITTGYTLTLPEGTSSVTFTPVKASSAAKLYFNGAKKDSLTMSGLKPNQTKTLTIKVVSPTNVKKTYTIKVFRSPSTNDNLTAMTVSNCTSLLTFNPAIPDYTMTVLEGKSSVTIKATKADSNETVYIDGHKATSRSISIKNSTTKSVQVKIVAQAGGVANTKIYTITLQRAPHINSFSGSPKVSGKPTVQINVSPAKPVKFTYSLASNAGPSTTSTIDLYQADGITFIANLMSRSDNAGTRTFIWDGQTASTPVSAGTYKVKLTVNYTYNGVTLTSASKWLTITVK